MTHRRRHVLLLMSVLCCLLLAAPVQAKDLCCVVNCGVTQVCHHWNTFMLWADAKCSALGIVASCRADQGGEAQVFAGNCVGQSICTPQNTKNSPATQGRGQSCKKDTDCPGSTRCSKPVFARNQCVVPCETNADCSSGEQCKKPVGEFARCK